MIAKRLLSIIVISGAMLCIIGATGPAVCNGPLFVQVHFGNPVSGISSEELQKVLAGQITSFKELGCSSREIELRADQPVFHQINNKYPHVSSIDLTDKSFASQKGMFSISDVRGLKPWFKTLYIDGTLPWGKLGADYTLEEPGRYGFRAPGAKPWRSRDWFTVVQIGVTAMTRSFIPNVERRSLDYPIRHTRGITSGADLALTSNEVSFTETCSHPLKDNLLFCSPEKYFSILLDSGFDIIELTGNHNNDFGPNHNRATMELYRENGINYFGGGRNAAEAKEILYRRVKDCRIAFCGFNEIGPPPAFAGVHSPGANRLTKEKFDNTIREASAKADIVFLSVQWCNENEPKPWKKQREYFHRAAELGATVMVSSSAHRVNGIEFHNGRFISYGIGNFLFDQMRPEQRKGIILRHHFYEGKHIETELIPYLIHHSCQPRTVHGSAAGEVLNTVFRYSGFK